MFLVAKNFSFSARGACQLLSTRNDGKRHEDRVWVIEQLKCADIRIKVEDNKLIEERCKRMKKYWIRLDCKFFCGDKLTSLWQPGKVVFAAKNGIILKI